MIYENILKLSKENGVSISEVELKSGLGNGTIGKWRNVAPRLDNLQKVAECFGVPISSLIEDNLPKSKSN